MAAAGTKNFYTLLKIERLQYWSLFTFSLLILFSSSIFAQKKGKMIELVNADRLKYVSSIQAKRLLGNVVFKHETTTLSSDSAYLYDNNTMEAYGRVVIRKGDSLTITGNFLRYDGNTKLGFIEGNVVCIDKEMTLTTNALNYDGNLNIASYFSGGTIISKSNTLTSRSGYYYTQSRDIWFKHDVKLTNPDYKLNSDTLRYNPILKTVYFLGPTVVKSKENTLYCERGWYNTDKQNSFISKNASIVTGKNSLFGDSIYYDKKTGIGIAMSNVRIVDTTQKIIVYGNRAKHNEKTGISIVTNQAVFSQRLDKDTLYMTADTLYSIDIQDTAAYRKLKTDSTIVPKDTTIMKAFYNVQIFKKDLQGVCDSLYYASSDSCMTLYKSPIMWSKTSQLTSKEMRINISKNTIKSFLLTGNAFVIEKVDSLKYNQIKGREILGTFEKDTLRKINVTGNSQVVYYLKDDKGKLIGLNKTDCTDMIVRFKKSGIGKITFIKKPKAIIIPIKGLDPTAHMLKGFVWLEEKRPKSVKSFFNQP